MLKYENAAVCFIIAAVGAWFLIVAENGQKERDVKGQEVSGYVIN